MLSFESFLQNLYSLVCCGRMLWAHGLCPIRRHVFGLFNTTRNYTQSKTEYKSSHSTVNSQAGRASVSLQLVGDEVKVRRVGGPVMLLLAPHAPPSRPLICRASVVQRASVVRAAHTPARRHGSLMVKAATVCIQALRRGRAAPLRRC